MHFYALLCTSSSLSLTHFYALLYSQGFQRVSNSSLILTGAILVNVCTENISPQREAFCPKNTTYMKPYVNLPLATVSGKAGSRLTHVTGICRAAEDRWITFQCECILKITKKSFPCIGKHHCQRKCDAHSPQLPSQGRNLSQWACNYCD